MSNEEIAREKWPLAVDAIERNRFKTTPFFLGLDTDGKRWECENLREYGRYTLSAFTHPEQFAPLDREPQERAEFRMELLEGMIRRVKRVDNKTSG
jgi:hypothetical protein